MKQPLLAVLVLTLDDGTEVFRSPPVGRIRPGESVRVEWSYPEGGFEPPEPATVAVTETYPQD